MHKYHTVYKTTCLVTGKYYIGKHSTDDVNDSYLGSGLRLLNSVKKHGRDQHSKEILASFATDKEAYDFEKEAVEPHLGQELCMNLIHGGIGRSSEDMLGANNSFYGKKHTAEAKAAIGAASRQRPVSEATRKKISEASKGRVDSEETRAKKRESMLGRVITQAAREKISKARKGTKASKETRAVLSKMRTGSGNNRAKLNEEQVAEIKRLLRLGTMKYAEIGEQFGVSRKVIGFIKTGKSWRHVN